MQRLLPVLSTYLGHTDLEGTKVYLSMTPELLHQASLRFARYAGEVRMPELVTLGPWLRRFLCEHIVTERNLARNTRKSYRDTFSLLLPFVSRKLRKPVDRLAVSDLTSRLCCSSSRISRKIADAPPGPAISGLRQSVRSPASSAAGIRPMSNGAATSGLSHRRSPCRHRSDG